MAQAGFEQLVRSIVAQKAPDSIEALLQMTPAQWDVYCKQIKDYKSGETRSNGWQFAIESALKSAAVPPRLAFVLSYIRSDIKSEQD